MKAYIEIISNNGVDFPRPLVEKCPCVFPNTPAHIVAELFASWVLECIDADFFDYFGDDAFWLHIGRRKGDKFSFRCIAHAGRDVYPFTVSSGDEICDQPQVYKSFSTGKIPGWEDRDGFHSTAGH